MLCNRGISITGPCIWLLNSFKFSHGLRTLTGPRLGAFSWVWDAGAQCVENVLVTLLLGDVTARQLGYWDEQDLGIYLRYG